jgi:AcrR family transcriptional regulator
MADSMSTGATARNRRRTAADILEAAETLLLAGGEPTMRSVAATAGIGERTIYRHFPTRDALQAALAEHIAPRLGVPLCGSADELETYASELFAVFEANRALTLATVTSPWCQPYLARSRSANLRGLTGLLRRAHPDASIDDVAAAAASLRTVLSGAGWVYQRESCELPAGVVISNAQWLVRAVRDRLDRPG